MKVPLYRLAHARSGDKGNTALLGVFAYCEALYPVLVQELTPELVARTFGHMVHGPVKRYEVPALHALNFELMGALGGGVSRSLALDNYGKALAARALAIEIEVPDALGDKLVERE